ncbi:MAG: 50S ribosomal protein L32 [Deltaproteobacteria bacterium]|nr:50S ribosomal protein L32 [Deltaproteobacteria bacterium]
MTVPKRRLSKMKGRQRRSHYHAITPTVVKCANCGAATLPHNVCPTCGVYRRRSIIEIKAPTTTPKGS